MNAARRCRSLLAPPFAAALALVSSGAGADELKFDVSGKIESDVRFRVEEKSVGSFYDKVDAPTGVERNQNLFSLKAKASYGKFYGVASADVYVNAVGNAKVQGFNDLTGYSNYAGVSPFSFEPQQIYVEAKGLFVKGLDLRIGNQLVLWGVADQFNPTNNLNADDVRDPLLFGKQIPNFMIKADYWLNDTWSISGVLVPVFKPALLPASAQLGAADIARMPFYDDQFRYRIESQFGYAASQQLPTVVHSLTPVLPGPSASNMQFAYRLAGTIGEQDVALSYYYGRTDFPQPFSNHTTEADGLRCDPNMPSNCITGVLNTDVLLSYPRMHVYGLNVSGEFNPFKKISEKIRGIGYRFEAALIVPQQTTIQLTQGALPGLMQQAGEYMYQGTNRGGIPPLVVDNTPFLKWTLGLDYTFGEHVYVNAQWVHGLADEFGAGDWMHPGYSVRQSGALSPTGQAATPINTTAANSLQQSCVLASAGPGVVDNLGKPLGTQCATETLRPREGDYLVLGADFKFLDEALLFRLFTVWDMSGVVFSQWQCDQASADGTSCLKGHRTWNRYSLFTKEGFSATVYPELSYNFGNGLTLSAGALVLLGRDYTKFGDPAAGGSLVFTRGRFNF